VFLAVVIDWYFRLWS